MKSFAALVPTLFVFVLFGGCMGGSGTTSTTAPQTHEYTLVVPAASSDTIEVYEKNDGNYSRVVAITFQDPDQDGLQVVPNPEIRVKEGDTVIIHVQNNNPLSHTLHLHGGLVPWDQDGVDYLTQMPIMNGEEFTYTFTNLKAGTYWYHCHMDGAHHIDLGMYGAFIVEERDPPIKADREYVLLLDEMDNCHVHGNTDPLTGQERTPNTQASVDCDYRFLLDNLAQNRLATAASGSVPQPARDAACPQLVPASSDPSDVKLAKQQAAAALGCEGSHEHGTPPPQQTPRSWWPETAPVYAPVYNTFMINGKAFPDTPVMAVKESETVRVRLINAGNQMHSFHPHGHTMDVQYRDGYALGTAAFKADTLTIGPGERYDFFMTMNNPGLWMIHDQNGLAAMNDSQHPGGMMMCFAYDGFEGVDAFAMTRSLDCNTEAIRILGEHQHA